MYFFRERPINPFEKEISGSIPVHMLATFWSEENVEEWRCKKRKLDKESCDEQKLRQKLVNSEREKMVKNGGKLIKFNDDADDWVETMSYRKPKKLVQGIKEALGEA